MGKMTAEKNASRNQGNESEPVRKSTRARKKRVLDGESDEEDLEIRYLENLQYAKAAVVKDQQNSMVYKNEKQQLDGKNISRSKKGSDNTDDDYEEEDVLSSESEHESTKMSKNKGKDFAESPSEGKRSFSLTTRQRALLCGKDSSSASGASQIEFPNGLPPAAPRKQKEKLSEAEQLKKKAEAAQKRKIQLEKAAMELEAEAIRKILGQESGRMKRECKIKKRQEELAQEKADKAKSLESSTIKWVINSSGTTVIFPQELPSIFTSKPAGYPPPRESCAGPLCSNPYKYRDSKTNVPLCSLKCYKAVHAQMDAEKDAVKEAEKDAVKEAKKDAEKDAEKDAGKDAEKDAHSTS